MDLLTLADAVHFLRAARPRLHGGEPQRQLRTVLKAVIGAAASGDLWAQATEFRAHATPLDDGALGERDSGVLRNEPLDPDLWRPDSAAYLSLHDRWTSNAFENTRRLRAFELPYLLTKGTNEWQLFDLTLAARGISFDAEKLDVIAKERDWQPWLTFFNSNMRPGRRSTWQWDRAKARLTVIAARDPTLLECSLARLSVRLLDILAEIHGFAPADDTTARDYARLILEELQQNHPDVSAPN